MEGSAFAYRGSRGRPSFVICEPAIYVRPNNEWNDFFLEEGCVLFDGTRPHPAGTPTEPPVVSAVLALAHVWQ